MAPRSHRLGENFYRRQLFYGRQSCTIGHMNVGQLRKLLLHTQRDILIMTDLFERLIKRQNDLIHKAHLEERSPSPSRDDLREIPWLSGDGMSREQLLNAVKIRRERVNVLDSHIRRHRQYQELMETELQLTQIHSRIQSTQGITWLVPGHSLDEDERLSRVHERKIKSARISLRRAFVRIHNLETIVDSFQREIPSRHRNIHRRLKGVSKGVADHHRKLRQLERLLPAMAPPRVGNRPQRKRSATPRKANMGDLCKRCQSILDRDPLLREYFRKELEGKPSLKLDAQVKIQIDEMPDVKVEEDMNDSCHSVLPSNEEVAVLQRYDAPSPEVKKEDRDEDENGSFSCTRSGTSHQEQPSPKIKIEHLRETHEKA